MTEVAATPESTASVGPTSTAPIQLVQSCTNEKYGFNVSYPTGWYTNGPADVHGDRVATCTAFAPFADFDVLPEAVNVPIFLHYESGSLPENGTALSIDGHPAVLVETEVNGVDWYVYYARITADMRFAGFALDNGSAPFEQSRAVLDAMITSLNLTDD